MKYLILLAILLLGGCIHAPEFACQVVVAEQGDKAIDYVICLRERDAI